MRPVGPLFSAVVVLIINCSARMLRRVACSPAPGVEVAVAMDEKAAEESDAGKATPVSVGHAAANGIVTPRFPADEGVKVKNGIPRRKVRCIDDFTASLINAATAVGESIHHDTLDVLAALLHYFGGSGQRIRFRKDDFVGAYKTLPLRADDLDLAFAVWRDAHGQMRALRLLCCPFGAVSSVHAWHRVGAAVQCILANLFAVVYARYVDDLFSLDAVEDGITDSASCFIGPTGTARLARFVIQDLLGWDLDEEKRVTDARTFVALGVEVSFEDDSGTLVFRVGEERASKWQATICYFLRAGEMLPSEARKLAGKLSWGGSVVFGRGARAYLAPLFFHACGGKRWLSRRLRAALAWWLRFLAAIPERRIPATPLPTLVITLFADATGGGRLAWVAAYGDTKLFAKSDVPLTLRRWVHYRKQQISTWELVAALCALWSFLGSSSRVGSSRLQINLFIDSNVALGTLLRGTSRQTDLNELVTDIWFQAASRATLLLAWRVPSKLNVADAPTRPGERASELRSLIDAGFRETEWLWPERAPWEQVV